MQYDSLSDIYDEFNDGADYDKYLQKVYSRFDIPRAGLALDCGCGTGALMEKLFEAGYDCTGVDCSEQMLQQAQTRLSRAGKEPHLIQQDLTKLDLYGAYDVVFCTLDTINHILDKRELKRFFMRLYNFIEYNGCFIFDAKTEEAFLRAKEHVISERGNDLLAMRGDFNGKYAIYELNAFIENDDEKYTRVQQTVEERYYAPEELKKLIESSGLTYLGRIKFRDRHIYAARKQRLTYNSRGGK